MKDEKNPKRVQIPYRDSKYKGYRAPSFKGHLSLEVDAT